MRLIPSKKRGNGTPAPPSTGAETASVAPPAQPATLSPARQRLVAALNASVVVDAKGARISEAIGEAERDAQIAGENLEDLLASDRRKIAEWLERGDGSPKPEPRSASIEEANRQLETATRALSDLRLALAEHDRSMEPARAEARRHAEAIPFLALQVIAEEAAKLIEEWRPLLYQVARIHLCLESYRAMAYQSGDIAKLRVAETIMHSMDAAARGFPRNLRPGLPPDTSDPRSWTAQARWAAILAALAADPTFDVVSAIKSAT